MDLLIALASFVMAFATTTGMCELFLYIQRRKDPLRMTAEKKIWFIQAWKNRKK